MIKTNRLLTRRNCIVSISLYLVSAVLVLIAAPFIGSEPIRPGVVFRDIIGNGSNRSTEAMIFVYQRAPRVLLGFLVGGSLALVGGVLQVILRNPLAAPATLGLTGAGSVGAVLAISIPTLSISWGPFSTVQLFALLGSALALGAIYLMARSPQGVSMNTLLLAGVMIGIICGAVIPLIRFLAHPNYLVAMDRWMMGGLDVIGFRELAGLFPFLLPGVGLLFMQMSALNHLSLGEEIAMGQGVNVAAVQRVSFIAGSLSVAGVVSIAGPIFFVGLIVPHCVRRISGFDHRIVLPGTFLAGGTFLVFCDIFARTLIAPTEMPVGIITAILGGPFFIYLLIKKK